MLGDPVGERIRYARRGAGLTQVRLAEVIGVHHPSVSNWETGQSRPSHRYRVALAEATGYPVEFFRHPGPGGSAADAEGRAIRKKCTGPCRRTRRARFFRVLSSGYLQGMCVDCERAYERERWHRRTPQSKARSAQQRARLRRDVGRARSPNRTTTWEGSDEELLSPHEAAELLTVSPRTMLSWARAGQVPCIRLAPRLIRWTRPMLREIRDRAILDPEGDPRRGSVARADTVLRSRCGPVSPFSHCLQLLSTRETALNRA